MGHIKYESECFRRNGNHLYYRNGIKTDKKLNQSLLTMKKEINFNS